jgi:hypothetical protein
MSEERSAGLKSSEILRRGVPLPDDARQQRSTWIFELVGKLTTGKEGMGSTPIPSADDNDDGGGGNNHNSKDRSFSEREELVVLGQLLSS